MFSFTRIREALEELILMEKTWKPTTAGILSIISGIAGIGSGSLALAFGALGKGDWLGMSRWGMRGGGFGDFPTWGEFDFGPEFMMGAGIALIVVGVIALIGGIYAIKRTNWGRALTGSILSVAGIPPLGVLSIIFNSLSRREFK
jgi:hypothetical protein